jgi:hypothetical protein
VLRADGVLAILRSTNGKKQLSDHETAAEVEGSVGQNLLFSQVRLLLHTPHSHIADNANEQTAIQSRNSIKSTIGNKTPSKKNESAKYSRKVILSPALRSLSITACQRENKER